MPDGSGLELVYRLRDRHGEEAFPVLILSTLRSESDILRGFAAGADDYLSKPFSRDELLAKCAVLLNRRKPAKATAPIGEPGLPQSMGLVFGRFELRGLMGRGTYGTVYDAYDRQMERPVALKVLSALHGNEPSNRLRFLRESYALSSVNHPNLVQVIDFGLHEGRLYYAMDRIEGPTLKEHIQRHGPASSAQAHKLFKGLSAAIQALARANLVHRDLKPSNIILRGGDFSDPVVVDFGLAKRTFDRGVTDPLTLLGTPGYIAPELIRGEEADARSDLFSLGLVLRFALEGEDIFPDLGGYELLNRIAEGPIPLPAGLPQRFSQVLQALLRNDRGERMDPEALTRALVWLEQRSRVA